MKHLFFTLLFVVTSLAVAQSVPDDIKSAIKGDNAVKFSKLVTDDNINVCYDTGNSNYTLLALTIKYEANECFKILVTKKANSEKACASKTPLMYAVKYGQLSMVKALVKAGADYKTENGRGQNATYYAKKYDQKEIYDYLKELKK